MGTKWILIGSGVALIAASVLVPMAGSLGRKHSPGALKATRASLHWVCPAPSESRSPEQPDATFEVVNVGGAPVRILSVTTSCGCASARAEPLLVPPGGRSAVAVKMEPIDVGQKGAAIVVGTDSPQTPEVRLQLIEEGWRRPPYVLEFRAELFYQQGFSREEVREAAVKVVTSQEAPDKTPLVTSDLPFLECGAPKVSEEPYLGDPRKAVRTYVFPVRFSADPPSSGFSGMVSVADPWVPDQVLRRNVIGEANRPIRAVPSRLILDVSSHSGTIRPARLLARWSQGPLALRVEPERKDSPLVVKSIGAEEDGFSVFDVSWKAGTAVTEGVFNLIVRPERAGKESLTVPVMVRRREG